MKQKRFGNVTETEMSCTGLSGPVRIETALYSSLMGGVATLHRPFGAGED